MTSLQIRAGRTLLGWSQLVLADRAGVAPITVKRLESATDGFDARWATVDAVVRALEDAGVVLLPPSAQLVHGVALRATAERITE